ncbi:MAG: TonB-dependent receptor [Gammaproteobacteria bacterium]|nr:TonB-dependent receptor [Gammaproteobacteria bacterium]
MINEEARRSYGTNHKLGRAVRLALLSAGALGAGLAGIASAEDKPAPVTTIDTVTITGTRIARPELVSGQPVEVINQTAIAQTGLNSVGDVLQNITSSDGSGLMPVSTATNGGDGTQNISLRGLDADRVLTLVDGRRWVTDLDGVVDLNTIPLAMIERVEVLKDGASAIYGSDAIAGVINVITKKNFDGISLDSYWGQTEKGDGTRQHYALTMGASGERSNVTLSLSYATQDEIMAGDREISKVAVFGCQTPPNSVLCGSSFPAYGRIFSGTPSSQRTLIPGRPGTSPTDFTAWTNAARYNFAPINYLQLPVQRYNLFVSGHMELNDAVEAYTKLTYVKRTSDNQIAEVPLTIGVSGPQWNWRPGANVTADNVFNPFDVNIPGIGFRMIALGPRENHYDYDTYGLNAGLRGKFSIGERQFHWDVGWQRNDGQYDNYGPGYVNLFNLANALGPSFRDEGGNLFCGTPGNVIRGCVPFNLFGGPDLGLAAGVITAEQQRAMLNYVGYTLVETAGNTTTNYYADISGELFGLPGGMAAFALGVEYRKDSGFNQPDTLVASGGSSTNFTEPTSGFTSVEEAYLELSLPLLADVAGAQELEFNAAVRYSDYRGGGKVGLDWVDANLDSDSTARIGLRWRPVDSLLIRANWGQTFRAPSVSDLYSGGGESFPQAADPCNTTQWGSLDAAQKARCAAQGVPTGGAEQPTSQLRELVGGNPLLGPEKGENVTVGFVWTPTFVENLDIVVDYWNIQLDDAQSSFGSQTILNRCILSGDLGFCNFIERSGTGGIEAVRATRFNAAAREVEGIDVGVRYGMTTERFGAFRFSWDTTYTMSDETQSEAGEDWYDEIGIYNGEPHWEYRSIFTTNWTMGDFSTTWTMRYMSKLEEDCWIHYYGIGDIDPESSTYNPIMCNAPTRTNIFDDTGTNFLRERLYHDLQVAWTTPWEGVLTVGARNLFGTEPPKTQNSFAHSFDGSYDLPGGAYWYLTYKHDFR